MIKVTDIVSLSQIYDYQMQLSVPYFFSVDFDSWKTSFEQDVDGEGRRLFKTLTGKAAYDSDVLVGFVQYGMTAFGFDDRGEISAEMSYPVIRALYFDEGREDAGRVLLQAAMEEFCTADKVYAFFHYFGMSCFARHGKLFEGLPWIAALLHKAGLIVEHENVYYSAVMQDVPCSDVALVAHHLSKSGQQSFDFVRDGEQVGCCEVHYVNTAAAYLRWIYIFEQQQNRGVGTQCMNALKAWLWDRGITRLDTDTVLDNHRAQHYYEKNAFTREGITRSYHLIK